MGTVKFHGEDGFSAHPGTDVRNGRRVVTKMGWDGAFMVIQLLLITVWIQSVCTPKRF